MAHAQQVAQIAIEFAKRHAKNGTVMQSSAELCLKDAEELVAKGDHRNAAQRALKSLSYSVGAFHAEYRAVNMMCGLSDERDHFAAVIESQPAAR